MKKKPVRGIKNKTDKTAEYKYRVCLTDNDGFHWNLRAKNKPTAKSLMELEKKLNNTKIKK